MGLVQAYLIENEAGLALVDAGMPGFERRVLRRMEGLGRRDLRLILITHAHLDHYGSAAALQKLTGAPVAIHRADAEILARGETPLGAVRGRGRLVKALMPLLQRALRPEPTGADLLLAEGDSLLDFGLDARVLHTPGHTPGSICLVVEGRHAFVGDLLSATGQPHAQRFFAHDWSQIPRSLARLRALKPERVYPGHGRGPVGGEVLQRLG
jgi:glyoxylase-like metal-dependent hydrolase (beta-lactamase superfamily II)